jgi:hypothetical protein
VKTVPGVESRSFAVALSPLVAHDEMSPAPTRTGSAASVGTETVPIVTTASRQAEAVTRLKVPMGRE